MQLSRITSLLRYQKIALYLVLLNLITGNLFAGTTGKLSGKVTDLSSGNPLIGANVVIEGTAIGAATDVNGNFVILNVSPGNYSVKAMMIGYSPAIYTGVQVNVDLTTTLDFALNVESIMGEEVVVLSNRNPIKEDISSSQVNISNDRIEDLAVTSVEGVVGMQAGVEGMSVRQGSTNELAVMLDGASMKDDRTGRPILGIPLSSVEEIMIMSGGFSAEYSDLQAGVISVITKEGSPDNYTFNLDYKHSPAAPKHFGPSVFDSNSYYLRPYLDDEVCWTGTDNGAWDLHTQHQYPAFDGWIKVSEQLLADDNPDNDLTPEGAQRLFNWQHRRQGDITRPDFNIDAGFGGPVPIIGKMLGNLRFYSSYKQEESMYFIPLSRDSYQDWTWTNKITSDLNSNNKLQFTSFTSRKYASSASGVGSPSYFESLYGVAGIFGGTSQTRSKIWYPHYYSLTDVSTDIYTAKLTTILDQKSFLETALEYSSTAWSTYPGDTLDPSLDYDIFPGDDMTYLVDEAPYGFDAGISRSIDGFLMGVKTNARDQTVTSRAKLRFDYTNQIHLFHQVKGGMEFEYFGFQMNYGAVNPALPSGRPWTKWSRYPYQFNTYIQDKIEAKGWVATVGLRMEYFNPNGKWYDVDPYNLDLFSNKYSSDIEDDIPMKQVNGTWTFLPRLGISHPITTNSKLYFNYGHMRQKFLPDYLFGVRRVTGNAMSVMGNPYLPMEKTVTYELGYDQVLFRDYLLHAAAYYKDKSDQANTVSYQGAGSGVDYSRYENKFYQDIRGLEIELRKRVGTWVTGFVNYTYSVGTSGYFGLRQMYQDPSLQRDYSAKVSYQEQSKPIPRPRVNFNLAFHVPKSFGPTLSGVNPAGGWNMTFTGYWKAGAYATYGGVAGVTNNVRWVDTYNVNFRASKSISVKNFNIAVVCDIYNVFSFKFLSLNALGDQYFNSYDRTDYYDSLHFPQKVYDELSENHLAGDDRMGDYRPLDVDYQAMDITYRLDGVTDPSTIYFVNDLNQWIQLDENGIPTEVSQSKVDKLLDDKAYIDNPNISSFMFLNPRDIWFGIKLSYSL